MKSIDQIAKECNVEIDKRGGAFGDWWVKGTRADVQRFMRRLDYEQAMFDLLSTLPT